MNHKPNVQDDVAVMSIASLRLTVGFLGERDNAGWWTSGFLSATSTAFLSPVFGTNIIQARYQGVVEAAKRIHDERIGIGHVFHLFRLPENMEQRLFEVIQSSGPDLVNAISVPETARMTLDHFAGAASGAKAGPALITSSDEGAGWINETASLYSAAFGAGIQCFPYHRALDD